MARLDPDRFAGKGAAELQAGLRADLAALQERLDDADLPRPQAAVLRRQIADLRRRLVSLRFPFPAAVPPPSSPLVREAEKASGLMPPSRAYRRLAELLRGATTAEDRMQIEAMAEAVKQGELADARRRTARTARKP